MEGSLGEPVLGSTSMIDNIEKVQQKTSAAEASCFRGEG